MQSLSLNNEFSYSDFFRLPWSLRLDMMVTEKNQRHTRMERNRMKLFLTQRRDAQHSCRYIEQRHPNTLKARLWDSTTGFSNFYTSFTDWKTEVTPVHWIKGKRSLNLIVLSMQSLPGKQNKFSKPIFSKARRSLLGSQTQPTSLFYKVLL